MDQIDYYLMRRLAGVKSESSVRRITKAETLMINVGSLSAGGKVTFVNDKILKVTNLNFIIFDKLLYINNQIINR